MGRPRDPSEDADPRLPLVSASLGAHLHPAARAAMSGTTPDGAAVPDLDGLLFPGEDDDWEDDCPDDESSEEDDEDDLDIGQVPVPSSAVPAKGPGLARERRGAASAEEEDDVLLGMSLPATTPTAAEAAAAVAN